MPEHRFARPRVVISECIAHEACRYNGAVIEDRFVERLKSHVEFLPTCPEVGMGMGVPRDPIRIVVEDDGETLYQPSTGRTWSQPMARFAEAFLGELEGVDGFLLKSGSPSCGPANVKSYHGREDPRPGPRTTGLFAREVMRRFPDTAVEDEGRLRNFNLREHFLTRLYTTAGLRELRETYSGVGDLVEFHRRNKLLLMAYDQERARALGRIVANEEQAPAARVLDRYGQELARCMREPIRPGPMINALQHAFGGVSRRLEPRDQRIPLAAVLKSIQAWAEHYEETYLLEQTLFRPYPLELVTVSDSGKGRV